jgi:hypothetical protein
MLFHQTRRSARIHCTRDLPKIGQTKARTLRVLAQARRSFGVARSEGVHSILLRAVRRLREARREARAACEVGEQRHELVAAQAGHRVGIETTERPHCGAAEHTCHQGGEAAGRRARTAQAHIR